MEVTQEQLHEMVQSEVNAAIAAKSLAPVKARRNIAWMELKNDISKFVNEKYGKNPKAYSLSDAVKTIIRFHLGVSNVYQINESNIDEARRIFELLKANI
ncbi:MULTISPECIES: hypothetical protein [Lactiplantibacillus]|uniref:hypothetical protein n=1 Tax=Lactiplantibacillus TaxID=2767842 RepID=UPI0007B555FA|nr:MULTISPECIES: hypothetical protein [Lactiplantibacillus]AUI78161.1 hypothetical protein BB562_05330 [Lactiplantibacillus pentosus]MBQ0836531.1 hypothetical protein [Lactiplantibacillus pentosus]MCB5220496.1 hypothetical protein [Lactiplantibacillus pentosus]MCG0738797.1 hypothetical protein [Lactiplantibacillus plantarum]MCK6240788.1 hypothetical protein [Lactiplantibacillus plantarum]